MTFGGTFTESDFGVKLFPKKKLRKIDLTVFTNTESKVESVPASDPVQVSNRRPLLDAQVLVQLERQLHLGPIL
jgi:hypothetical protein